MTTSLSPIIVSRLEKAATDNGFDQELERDGDWLVFASTQCPLRVWLGAFGDAVFLAAFCAYLDWHRAHLFPQRAAGAVTAHSGAAPPGLGLEIRSVGEQLGKRGGRQQAHGPCLDLPDGCRRDALLDVGVHLAAKAQT